MVARLTRVLSDEQLLERARQAGELYHTLYGRYPARIGIHPLRCPLLAHTFNIFFLERKPPLAIAQVAELVEVTPAAELIRVPIEIVMGEDISEHEVYFPHPYDPEKAISFPGLQKLFAERGDK